jgi:hypothetical protein
MFEILQDRYPKHDEFLERIASSFQTEADIKSFNSLVADLYEMGYLKATNDHRKTLKELGYSTQVVPQPERPKKDTPTIFPQEKSG